MLTISVLLLGSRQLCGFFEFLQLFVLKLQTLTHTLALLVCRLELGLKTFKYRQWPPKNENVLDQQKSVEKKLKITSAFPTLDRTHRKITVTDGGSQCILITRAEIFLFVNLSSALFEIRAI